MPSFVIFFWFKKKYIVILAFQLGMLFMPKHNFYQSLGVSFVTIRRHSFRAATIMASDGVVIDH